MYVLVYHTLVYCIVCVYVHALDSLAPSKLSLFVFVMSDDD